MSGAPAEVSGTLAPDRAKPKDPAAPTPGPPSASTPPPKAPTPAAPPTPQPAPPPPRSGDVVDDGPGRHVGLRAATWRCSSGAKVLGDVDVGVAELHGPVGVKGKITADRLTIDGSLAVMGALSITGSLVVTGELRVDGPISVGSLALTGNATLGAPLAVTGGLVARGRLTAAGDVRGESVQLDGEFDVVGDLTATSVDARIRAASRAGSIAATKVTVRRESRPFGPRPELTVLRIESSEADLEGVRCEYVRAERIALGAGTHVSRYDGTIVQRHRTAHVGPESESPPPYGLTR